MIFKGLPGEHVVFRPKQNEKNKKVRLVGVFDEKGLLEATEPFFIQRMGSRFEAVNDGKEIMPEPKKRGRKRSGA